MKKIILIITLITATSSVKPMYQPILEKTADFLVEAAPEIAKVGGSLAMILTQNARSDNKMMEPKKEDETLTDSQKSLSAQLYLASLRDASDEADKHDFCDTF